MFTAKGFEHRGPDPLNGKGGYACDCGVRSPEPRGGLKDPDAHIPLDQFQFRP